MNLDGLHMFSLPHGLDAIWRGAYFILAAVTLGAMWVFLTTHASMPSSRKLLMGGLALVVLRTVVVNIERWGGALHWEGLPVDSLVLVLAAAGLRQWIREQRRS